jgi:hypothetical protein
MRKRLFLLCLFCLPCAALAQINEASWAKLKGLTPGQTIQIIDVNAKKHSGTFLSASEASIAYTETTGQHSIDKLDVRSVKLMETHHGHNTLVGFAVGGGAGAAVGAVIGAATYKGCQPQTFCLGLTSRGELTGIGAVAGFAGGAIVGAVTGALVPSHTTIYSLPPKPSSATP